MSEADSNEKTEDATPERRRKAREDGQFPRSRDAGAIAASAAVLLCLAGFGPDIVAATGDFAHRCFAEPAKLLNGDSRQVGHSVMMVLAMLMIPPAVAAALGGFVMGVTEAGWNPKLELAAPKWDRLDPIPKLGQLFSPKQAATSSLLLLGRVFVVGWIAYNVVGDAMPALTRLARADLRDGVREILQVGTKLGIWGSLGLAVLAALDFGHSWYQHEQRIKMSRQELKEEIHQQEGDPRVRARQRAKAREMSRKGIAKEVKTADVVIANPTHVSVALRYRPERGAPIVVAKGYDEIALHIRKIAQDNDILVVENVPLARALADRVKVGRAIPVELYAAVAEVLAFVFRARNKKRGVRA